MKLSKNDPRLTAYVLGELNQADRALIEKAIQEDPSLKIELALLQKNILLLKKKEVPDLDFKLTPKQRSEIFSQIATKKKTFTPWHYGFTGGGLVAASLAVLVFTHSLKEDVVVYDAAPIQAQAESEAQEDAPTQVLVAKKVEIKLEKPRLNVALAKKSDQPAHGGFLGSGSGGTSGNDAEGALGSSAIAGAGMAAGSVANSGSSFKGGAPKESAKEGSPSTNYDETAAATEAPALQAETIANTPASAKMASRSALKSDINRFLPEQNNIQLISIKPEVESKFFTRLEKLISQCFVIDIKKDFGVIEISWLRQSLKLEVTPSRTSYLISEATKSCLQSTFVNTPWPRSGLFVFKIQSVSKLNTEK